MRYCRPHQSPWLYLTALAEVRKPSTIRRRLASISVAHQGAGVETPTADPGVRAVWSGIGRRQGTAPRKMRAARTKVITAMVAPLGDGLADTRDRTLLLFGFAGAKLEYAHDRELRDKRLPHYQRLFHVSRAVPREWRPDAVPSRAELRRVREEFHGWYFGDDAGGMFLTDRARDLYFRLQNGLEATSGQRGHEEEPLTGQEQESLYKLASALRHQLSADVGTAQAPRLEWAPPGATLPPSSRSEVRR